MGLGDQGHPVQMGHVLRLFLAVAAAHQGEDGKEPQALIAEASEAAALNSGDVGRGKTFRHC